MTFFRVTLITVLYLDLSLNLWNFFFFFESIKTIWVAHVLIRSVENRKQTIFFLGLTIKQNVRFKGKMHPENF